MRPARAPRNAPAALVALTALVTLASLAPLACGGDVPQPPGGVVTSVGTDGGAPRPASPPPAPGAGAGPANAGADAGADAAPGSATALPPLPLREFQERDFAESDQSRDPFRNYAASFVNQAQTRTVVQRKVLVDHYALDELKLVGIVTRAQPRALLTDPGGLGWVAKVGDFVGKAELVHAVGPRGRCGLHSRGSVTPRDPADDAGDVAAPDRGHR